MTELVGREEELELLLRRWSRAKTGEGQVVLLSGEAGIGKSRLTAALLERVATEPHTRLRYFCSPQHTDTAFYPIIGQMERAAGFVHDDTAQAKLDKLDAVLAPTATSAQDAALFAEMLSLPNDGHYPALDLNPEHRRQRTLDALAAQLPGLARQQPVLMIVEDAHWIDPTSLEVFGRTVDQIKTLPGLLIVTEPGTMPVQCADAEARPRQAFREMVAPARLHNALLESLSCGIVASSILSARRSMSERRFVLADFTHTDRAGVLQLYEAGHTYALSSAIAHAATKRELVAKQRPADWMPPSMFQFPKVLTEAEVIEAEEELKALQRHAFAIVHPEVE